MTYDRNTYSVVTLCYFLCKPTALHVIQIVYCILAFLSFHQTLAMTCDRYLGKESNRFDGSIDEISSEEIDSTLCVEIPVSQIQQSGPFIIL